MGRLVLLLFGLFFLSLPGVGQISLAPSVIGAGGAYAENEELSLSWTLGELAIRTLSSDGLVLTQGFQQVFDMGTGLEAEKADWRISVYPNPLSDELRIRFDVLNPEEFRIEIQDLTGRLIHQSAFRKVTSGDVWLIHTSSYTPGVYFLKIHSSDQQLVQVTSLRKL